MNIPEYDLVVLYEHPDWQKPLFEILDKRDIKYSPFDLKKNSFSDQIFDHIPDSKLYFNQASPSAYTRGNTRAVPFNLALMEYLEAIGKRVLNGGQAFRFELSKMTQIAVMQQLGIAYPKTISFNDINALQTNIKKHRISFPAVLKPNQGGSGARMFHVQSVGAISNLINSQPELWLPDNLLLLQEYLTPKSESEGIIRLEYLDGELLYIIVIQPMKSILI
ncbi:MAG: ATP-grasp domain-containing protein [Candidatus Hodarchaeales archaeon]|jgi:glutathione synthase/RimK-type ligase-like ATP-grasp enzyme